MRLRDFSTPTPIQSNGRSIHGLGRHAVATDDVPHSRLPDAGNRSSAFSALSEDIALEGVRAY